MDKSIPVDTGKLYGEGASKDELHRRGEGRDRKVREKYEERNGQGRVKVKVYEADDASQDDSENGR